MAENDAKKRRAAHIQRQLDEALEGTFPASDPVSIVTSQDEEAWDDESQEPKEPKEPSAPGPSPPGSRS
jgi:hypothetical protein